MEKIAEQHGGEKLRPSLEGVEKIIGYSFKERVLLEEAFRDPSDPVRIKKGLTSYERLEYVGDSVLNFVISTEHFREYPDLAQGMLTRLRAANVDTEKLARVAVQHGLHKFLRHNRPNLDAQIQEFVDVIPEYPLHSMGLIDAPKVLADIVESTIGAVFIDSNSSTQTISKVIKKLLRPMITPETLPTNSMTKLTELCQKKRLKVQVVDLWEETGAFEIYVETEFVGRGEYGPKKIIALNRAAEDAYNEILGNKARLGLAGLALI